MNSAATQLVVSGKTLGVQYAVVQSGAVVASGAAGRADLVTNAAVGESTQFRIGSVTKLFTAVAVMQLVDRHVLSLDDTLERFEPSFPSAARITVRDLLMHRSGIDNYLDAAIANGAVRQPTTPKAIIAAVASKPLLSPPGTTFAYSNTNYVILGQIVERLSGLTLHDYYRTKIFAPAEMFHTSSGSPLSGALVAEGYAPVPGGGFQPDDAGDVSWYYACGDTWSTANDLARLDVALMNGRLLKPATLRSMIDAAEPSTLGPRVAYGLGVMTSPSGSDDRFVGHHGGLPGFEADNEMLIADRFAVVSLGNSFTYPTSTLKIVAFEALYPNRARALRAEAVADAQSTPEDPALTQRFTKFFTSLLSGTVDSTGLSDAMSAALAPSVVQQVDVLLQKLGSFGTLRYVSQDIVQGYRRYHYTAVFSGGSQAVTFVLNADDKIGGFFLQ